MSEQHTTCHRFEDLLLQGVQAGDQPDWQPHLEGCPSCREQWSTHQMLTATFAEEAVPELSAGFEAGLQRKLGAAPEIQPLRGWRLVAMLGYALTAIGLLGWVFARFPIPIDPASPWIVGVAIGAVPLTLWMAIAATRWLPTRTAIKTTALGLL